MAHVPWTKQEDAMLARLVADGASSAEAALALGRSAAAVKVRVYAAKGALGAWNRAARLARGPDKPLPTMAEGGRGHHLADLDDDCCRWPVNDAGEGEQHLFCGQPAEPTGPYCRCHAARAGAGYSMRGLTRVENGRGLR